MITVESLLQCKKYINKKRKPEFQIDQRHYKMNIELECDSPNIKMTMFLRKLIAYPEDFTIGLRIDPPNLFSDHTVVLVRFQGPHGGQSEQRSMEDLHNNYHVHLYTQEDLVRHRKMASYKEAGNFGSFEQAIDEFLTYCNIEDRYGIFDDDRQRARQFMLDIEKYS